MRKEINENEIEMVVGGTVIISKDNMNVGFSSTREKVNLKDCTYREARNFVEDLKDANPGLTNAEFDALTRQKLEEQGWI